MNGMDLKHLNPNDYLRLKDVLRLYPVSKSTWWLGIEQGRYPKPFKLSTRITAWKVSDIQKLLQKASDENALYDQDLICDDSTMDGLNTPKDN